MEEAIRNWDQVCYLQTKISSLDDYISHRSLCVGIHSGELVYEEPSVTIPFDRGTPTAKLLKHIRSLDA